MNERNCIVREDSLPKNYVSTDKFISTLEILEKEYDYILQSMDEESFELTYDYCNIFNEILYENRVVGFSTYILLEVSNMALNAIYVLPEFRGNNYLLSEIEKVIVNGMEFSLINPSHRIIDILLQNDYAEEYGDLVIVPFNIIVPVNDLKCTYKNKSPKEKVMLSNFYNQKLSSTIIVDADDEDLPLYYSNLQDIDVREYDANRQRKKVNKKYFNRLRSIILDNFKEILEVLAEVKERIPRVHYELKDVVGVYPELSDRLLSFIDKGVITEDRASEIQSQITEEFNEGFVLAESLLKRLQFLVYEDSFEIDTQDEYAGCIYCNSPVDFTDNHCDVCGFSLEIPKEINKNLEELDEVIIEFSEELKKQGFSDKEIEEIISNELDEMIKDSEIFDE